MGNDLTNERWVAHRVHPEWQDGTRVCYVDSVSEGEICTVYGGGAAENVVTSRARLIAAAPDLLAALEHIAGLRKRADDSVGMVDNPYPRALNAAVEAARTAITKATGK